MSASRNMLRAVRLSSTSQSPFAFDFLLPAFARPRSNIRHASATSTSTSTSTAAVEGRGTNPQTNAKRPSPLTREQRDFLDSALRVNQAGELAATVIYAAQTPPIVRSHPHLRPLMKHMYDQEAGHFDTFNKLLAKHRVRPTAMYPVWKVAATALGWGTAMMGREAAMACTEAVETEIGGHYNGQVRVLLQMVKGIEERGEEVGEELRELLEIVRRTRDEELEQLKHLNLGPFDNRYRDVTGEPAQ
ncbi:MAG: ubiquinone biosynthesis monooxygenase Coq7 [Sclerophora amabilis]|nr:MAG: ubiquinone biosynthesis monooxygenase Coq7 [Sclerophora amabilis]